MIVTTTQTIDGYRVKEYKGIAKGIIVRTPTPGQNVSAKIQSVWGGKIGSLMVMCESTRHEAFELMVKQAEALGANAILSVRYDTSDLGEHGTEVICYGTAVLIEKIQTPTGNQPEERK